MRNFLIIYARTETDDMFRARICCNTSRGYLVEVILFPLSSISRCLDLVLLGTLMYYRDGRPTAIFRTPVLTVPVLSVRKVRITRRDISFWTDFVSWDQWRKFFFSHSESLDLV